MNDIDLRTVKFLDGFNVSFHILEHAYAGLQTTCSRIAEDREAFYEALLRCWAFIDTVHRLREVAQAVPQLSRRSPELKSFLEATEIAEGFRHYNQHLRRELSKREPDPFPVFGSLSWVDLTDSMCSHLAVAGALTPTTSLTGCVFDTLERKWVSTVCLGLGGLSFNFDPIYASCRTFADFVIPRLQGLLGEKLLVKPQVPVISMRLTPVRERDA